MSSGQDWSSDVLPCPDCGEPCIRAHGSSDIDDDTLFDYEPAGKGVVLRWKDNDNLPTQAHVREFHLPHECEGAEDEKWDRRRGPTIEGARKIIERGLPLHWQYHSEDPDTSKEAAAGHDDYRASQCELLYAGLLEAGEATAYELCLATGMDQYPGRQRVSDLRRMGLAEPTGDRRPTDSGEDAEVLRAVRPSDG